MPDGASRDGSPDGLRGRDLVGLGGLLAGAVVAGTALGYVVDQLVDTMPAFTLAGIALGIVAGGVGFWVRVRSALRDSGSS
jgi:F0F1-type ATP synthase assembly protein I